MFDNRRQSVPQLFHDKIAIDKIVDAFRAAKAVDLKEMTAALKKQKEIRRLCEIFCLSRVENQDGAGSPAGGTVGRLVNTTAIAA